MTKAPRDMVNGTQKLDPLPAWKRGFDLVGTSCGLVVLSPLMALIALHIKLTSKGPLLFKHKRYGYLGQPFYVWKFRSMQTEADPSHHQRHVMNMLQGDVQLTKMDNDALLIPLGKWLRSSGLDELPQLFDVLKGKMSLVGPRPDVVPLEQHEPWQQVRFTVAPGLTGLWQVSGKNKKTFSEMMRLDIAYVEQRSFWLDLKILLMTGPAVLRQIADELRPRRAIDADQNTV